MKSALFLLMASPLLVHAVIIDQIAITVDKSIVKDSDIDRDLRVTSFLNGDTLDLGVAARRTAGQRLVDQIFIRKEIEVGDYPTATFEQANAQIDEIEKNKYATKGSLEAGLARYGIGEPDLRSHFLWQLTVLRFIEARFKPAVLVTDAEIQKYFKEHERELKRANPAKSTADDFRNQITDILAEQGVDKLLFAWLDERRRNAKITYLEPVLRP